MSRRMRQAGHVTSTGVERSAYRVFVYNNNNNNNKPERNH
jgi:hypothetical protein